LLCEVGWNVYIARGKLTWLGSVEVRDRDGTLEKAIKELEIKPAKHWRLSIQRE
jgi:hypothetical protein